VIVGSLFERRAAGLYHNTAVILDADGSLLGKYRKMHIPDDPLYYEKFYFTPGDLGFPNFDTKYGRIGVLSAGINGIRRVRGSQASAAPTLFSIPQPSAGILLRSRNSAPRSSMPGVRFSAGTPSRTESSSQL
jgi:hypothetical protein